MENVKNYQEMKFAIRYYDGRFAVENYKTVKASLHTSEIKALHKCIDAGHGYKTLFFEIKELPPQAVK